MLRGKTVNWAQYMKTSNNVLEYLSLCHRTFFLSLMLDDSHYYNYIFIIGPFCSHWCWTTVEYRVCCCQHGWINTSFTSYNSLSQIATYKSSLYSLASIFWAWIYGKVNIHDKFDFGVLPLWLGLLWYCWFWVYEIYWNVNIWCFVSAGWTAWWRENSSLGEGYQCCRPLQFKKWNCWNQVVWRSSVFSVSFFYLK